MKTIKVCRIGENWHLGQILGNAKHDVCWAVECDEATAGALESDGKYYRRFDSFQDAENFCND